MGPVSGTYGASHNFCAGDLIIFFLFPGKPCGAVERSRGEHRGMLGGGGTRTRRAGAGR